MSYVSWKEGMKIFLQSIDIQLWYIVNEGPYEITIENDTTNRQRVKTRRELTAQDIPILP